MEKPISVGDLVMVVKSCCDFKLGVPGRVVDFYTGRWNDILRCSVCLKPQGGMGTVTAALDTTGAREHWRLDWLKRIDPPALPESTRTEETLKESA